MKYIIQESRKEELAFNFFMKEVGKFALTPENHRSGEYGFFHKDGKVVAKIDYDSYDKRFYMVLKTDIINHFYSTIKLFSLDVDRFKSLVSDHISIQYEIPNFTMLL